jgi:hypothetical protein
MIHNIALVDNENVRILAAKIAEIPGILTVQWLPPYRKSDLDLLGENGMLFKVILPSLDDVNYFQFVQRIEERIWNNPEHHPAAINAVMTGLQEALTKRNNAE